MKKLLQLLFVAVIATACSTSKDVLYFQDAKGGDTKNVTTLVNKIKMKPGDKITIVVNSKDPELTMLYNLMSSNRTLGSSSSTSTNSNGYSMPYTIDSYGNIDFPVIGKMNIEGKTREEVAEYIKNELITRKQVLDPVVIVEYVNQNFTVLGDVNRPGKVNIDRDQLTIIDAIALAGDLKVTGKRNDVTVLRQEGDTQKIYEIDLRDTESINSSPAYYIQQNDIVYVKPNSKSAGGSSINSNTLRSTSFWMSLASFVMALTTFIENR